MASSPGYGPDRARAGRSSDLPELFALDQDRLARFERKAQVLAALNHPNIAHVYGVLNSPRRW